MTETEQFKDMLAGQNAAADTWSKPLGSPPRVRYRILASRVFDFFTLAGALAYQEGELRGAGQLIELQ